MLGEIQPWPLIAVGNLPTDWGRHVLVKLLGKTGRRLGLCEEGGGRGGGHKSAERSHSYYDLFSAARKTDLHSYIYLHCQDRRSSFVRLRTNLPN